MFLGYRLGNKCSQLWMNWNSRSVSDVSTQTQQNSIFLCQPVCLLAHHRFIAFRFCGEETKFYYTFELDNFEYFSTLLLI
jgi:hypothetical protein